MRIGFYLSSRGGSPLEAGLRRGFSELGHEVIDIQKRESCDLLLVFNQSAHTTDYVYPDFPSHSGPMAFIDVAEYGWSTRIPEVIPNIWNTFAEGALAHDTKNREQQLRLKSFLYGKSFPYFIREFYKTLRFPDNYHPIDYPLYAYSAHASKPNRDEYLKRPLDLFVSWGASHPWRVLLTEALRELPIKSEIRVLKDGEVPRLPQHVYFEKMSSARCSVCFDGYGSGSFRLTEALVRCLLFQGPLSIHRYAPLINNVHCIEYAIESKGLEFYGSDLPSRMQAALLNPEVCYSIYERGYHHCMTHYTERATACYILKIIDSHDWSKPTELERLPE